MQGAQKNIKTNKQANLNNPRVIREDGAKQQQQNILKSNGQKNEEKLLKIKNDYQNSIVGWKKKIKKISQELEPKCKETENYRSTQDT